MPGGNRWRAAGGKLLLALGGTVAAVLLVEFLLWAIAPYHSMAAGRELAWFRKGESGAEDIFIVDREMGFRPRLGTALYDEWGVRPNGYPREKRPGVRRLLFLGDSVTARGRILDALRAEYGDERFEYWNAGVESFNLVQEVRYYERFNAAVRPDHVILTFHNNDFMSTPVVFRQEGKLVVFVLHQPLTEVNPWLFQYSRLYRILLGMRARIGRLIGTVPSRRRDLFDQTAGVAEAEESLMRLRGELESEGIQLTVLLLPVFRPYEDWSKAERRSREEQLRILQEGRFDYFDLWPVVEEAIRDGVPVEETPGDFWHPGDEAAARIASFLRSRSLLDGERE